MKTLIIYTSAARYSRPDSYTRIQNSDAALLVWPSLPWGPRFGARHSWKIPCAYRRQKPPGPRLRP